jgi:thioredoxin-related protein
MTDHEAALKKAKAENKLVVMNFTGSDWCGWCIKLKGEVFSEPAFKEYAEANVVLLELDFPRRIEQSDELKAQNRKLQQQYKIRGYPTVVVLGPDGQQVGELGYMPGGPETFVAELKKLQPKKS